MDHAEFMSKLHGPRFAWLMASGVLHPWSKTDDERPLIRSARTRMRNAQQAIDALVLKRARRILVEHDHGIMAACNRVCLMTEEERAAHRAEVLARYEKIVSEGV